MESLVTSEFQQLDRSHKRVAIVGVYLDWSRTTSDENARNPSRISRLSWSTMSGQQTVVEASKHSSASPVLLARSAAMCLATSSSQGMVRSYFARRAFAATILALCPTDRLRLQTRVAPLPRSALDNGLSSSWSPNVQVGLAPISRTSKLRFSVGGVPGLLQLPGLSIEKLSVLSESHVILCLLGRRCALSRPVFLYWLPFPGLEG